MMCQNLKAVKLGLAETDVTMYEAKAIEAVCLYSLVFKSKIAATLGGKLSICFCTAVFAFLNKGPTAFWMGLRTLRAQGPAWQHFQKVNYLAQEGTIWCTAAAAAAAAAAKEQLQLQHWQR